MANYSVPKRLSATGASVISADVVSVSAVFDFSTLPANASTDTVDIMQIPVGAVIMGGLYEVLTADGSASATVSLIAGGITIRTAATGNDSTGIKTSLGTNGASTGTDVVLTSAVAALGTLKVKCTVIYAMPASAYTGTGGFTAAATGEPSVIVAVE